MALSKETVAAIKDRADIVQIIGERVQLQRSGGTFKGLCPFHSEKTPSFTVNPARGFYKCFGCDAGGSVIDFVMAYERLSFPEACERLANQLGIDIGHESRAAAQRGERSLEVLESARRFYHEQLLHSPQAEAARRYLLERSLDEEAWAAFGLGWAMDAWQGLTDHALGRGFRPEDLVGAGLIKPNQHGGHYDLLRKRVTFPILDERGRPIAFGGRVIDKLEQPKYLNTPETRHYHKSQVLYGLGQGAKRLREQRRAVLVEGYLDVMRLHLNGFAEAVATCGTALTEQHLRLLERYVDRVLLVFDGDEAGIRAAIRSAPLFLNKGLEARVVLLPDALDPDDFVVKHGPEAFGEALEQATPLLEYVVLTTLRRNGSTLAGKEKTLQTLLPLLTEVRQEATRDITMRYLADLLELRVETVAGMVNSARPKGASASHGAPAPDGPPAAGAPAFPPESSAFSSKGTRHQRRLLQLLLAQRGLLAEARSLLTPSELADPELRRLYETLCGLQPEEFAALDVQALRDAFPDQANCLLGLVVEEDPFLRAIDDPGAAMREKVLKIKEEQIEQLFAQCRRLVGQEEEEFAVRRYLKARSDLRALQRELGPLPTDSGAQSV